MIGLTSCGLAFFGAAVDSYQAFSPGSDGVLTAGNTVAELLLGGGANQYAYSQGDLFLLAGEVYCCEFQLQTLNITNVAGSHVRFNIGRSARSGDGVGYEEFGLGGGTFSASYYSDDGSIAGQALMLASTVVGFAARRTGSTTFETRVFRDGVPLAAYLPGSTLSSGPPVTANMFVNNTAAVKAKFASNPDDMIYFANYSATQGWVL